MTRAARARAGAVGALAALFALGYGLRYGVHNQHTYLLRAARRAQPALFARDWLVARATDYHPAFSALAGALLASPWPAWAVALANVLVLFAAGLLVYFLAREAVGGGGRAALAAFLVVTGWASSAARHEVLGSVGVSALFTNYLVPANLGSLGLLAALVAHARGRFLLAGLAAAAGGLFHANYLVLAPPLLLLASLLDRPPALGRALLAQLGPCAAVLLVRLPELLAMSRDPLAAEGRRIFLTIRSPHHYVPLGFLPEFAAFFGWQLVGLAAARALGPSLTDAQARLRALFVSALLMLVAATLLTTVVYVPVVAQLYVFRLAPVAVLLALLFLAAWLAAERAERFVATLVLVELGAAAVAWRASPGQRWALAALLLLVLATPLLQRGAGRRALAAAGVGAALLAVGVTRGLSGLGAQAAALGGALSDEEELYGWAQTTAVDAVFAIPPDLEAFRLSAGRAVVVDWKSTPVLPSEVCEWYRRLTVVAGRAPLADEDTATRGYQTMGPWRIARLRDELGVDYVVLRSPFPRTRLPEYPVAFADRRFIVFDVRTPAPLPSRPRNTSG